MGVMQMQDYYTIKEFAEILKVSKDTIRRRIKAGEIAAEKKIGFYGEEYHIPGDQLGAYISEEVQIVQFGKQLPEEKFIQIFQEQMQPMLEHIKSLEQEIKDLKKGLNASPGKRKFWNGRKK